MAPVSRAALQSYISSSASQARTSTPFIRSPLPMCVVCYWFVTSTGVGVW